MCGIIGMVSFDKGKDWQKRKEWLTQALYADSLRGMDGTGVFGVRFEKFKDENVDVFKRPIAGYDFVSLPQVTKFANLTDQYKFVIGHNRLISKGKAVLGHTHPFQHEHITLVHNGHLITTSYLDEEWTKFEVDSDLIAYALSKRDYKDVLSELDGAAALVWHDSKTDVLHLYRNKDRPLFFSSVKDSNTTLIASELEMIRWLAWRCGMELEKNWTVKEDTVVTFDKSHSEVTVEKIVPKPKPALLPNWKDNIRNFKSAKKQGMTWREADAWLEQMQLVKGTLVEFEMEEIVLPEKNSKHGKIIGSMVQSPWLEVVSYGVDKKLFKLNKIFTGKIVSAETLNDASTAVVLGTKIVETDKPVVQNSAGNGDYYDGLNEDNYYDGFVPGPQGRLIPQYMWKDMTKDGCSKCQADLTDPDKVRWIEGNPWCIECSKTNFKLIM